MSTELVGVLYVKKKTAAPSIYMLATLYTLWFAICAIGWSNISQSNAYRDVWGRILLTLVWPLRRVLAMKMPLLISTILYRNDPLFMLYTMVLCPGMNDTVKYV